MCYCQLFGRKIKPREEIDHNIIGYNHAAINTIVMKIEKLKNFLLTMFVVHNCFII